MMNHTIKAKQFRLPIEETNLSRVLNMSNIVIVDKKVFQDKLGDVVVYLEWEEYINEEVDPF